jgi:hypothetical protein
VYLSSYKGRVKLIYYRCEYTNPYFLSSILNQFLVSIFPVLCLSRYLVVFPKVVNPGIVKLASSSGPGSNCKWRKCCLQNVYHGIVGCKMYMMEVLGARCISRNMRDMKNEK